MMAATVSQNDPADTPERLEDVLDVLSDQYACRILVALDAGPMPAVELAEGCDMSRPTVYRRLDQLESVGFVSDTQRLEPDGTQRKYFRSVLDEVHFEIGTHGIDGQVSVVGEAET
jgi:DNA-binding transcriptional ArsR family regulator